MADWAAGADGRMRQAARQLIYKELSFIRDFPYQGISLKTELPSSTRSLCVYTYIYIYIYIYNLYNINKQQKTL